MFRIVRFLVCVTEKKHANGFRKSCWSKCNTDVERSECTNFECTLTTWRCSSVALMCSAGTSRRRCALIVYPSRKVCLNPFRKVYLNLSAERLRGQSGVTALHVLTEICCIFSQAFSHVGRGISLTAGMKTCRILVKGERKMFSQVLLVVRLVPCVLLQFVVPLLRSCGISPSCASFHEHLGGVTVVAAPGWAAANQAGNMRVLLVQHRSTLSLRLNNG